MDHVLGADLIGDTVSLGRLGGVEHDLDQAAAIAQIDEDQVAVVTAAVDPASQLYILANVLFPQFAAEVGLQHRKNLRQRRYLGECVAPQQYPAGAGRLACRQTATPRVSHGLEAQSTRGRSL